MGGGSWTSDSFKKYSTSLGRSVDAYGTVDTRGMDASQIYKSSRLDPDLDPNAVIRECRDSEEHPNTIPVILALDVTGSMGDAAVEVASKLNNIITELYKSVKDIEFMVMGIGDFAYDKAPLQVSQFESDIRIAEQLDKIFFEFGGGGNVYESYTAAWKFAVTQTDLDCWKRGKKGIIITMGDEELNPHIPTKAYAKVTGTEECQSIETPELYKEVIKKFDVFHLDVNHFSEAAYNRSPKVYDANLLCRETTWKNVIGDHYFRVTIDEIKDKITEIINSCVLCESAYVPESAETSGILETITW